MSRMRFSEGGWVLLVAIGIMLLLAAWALAPAVLRMTDRPAGDGHDPATYGFDLTNLRLPGDARLEAALMHRDMVPARDDIPGTMSGAEASKEKPRKGPFLTSGDLVIGVERNGEARAYPLLLLNVHEAIGDTLGGEPIVVTWHWPSGVTAVYDAHVNGTQRQFGVSGLVAGGGQLLYLKRLDGETGNEPLISQFTGSAISGEPLDLTPVPATLTTWSDWRETHPHTDVVAGDPVMTRRYKDGKPDTYFHSSGLLFDVPVPEEGPGAKQPAAVFSHQGHVQVVTAENVRRQGGELDLEFGGDALVHVKLTDGGRRLDIDAPPDVHVRRGLWHIVHATGPWGSSPKR